MLPGKLLDALFPAGSPWPLGLTLGMRSEGIAVPAWFDDAVPARDGTASGSLADDDPPEGEGRFPIQMTVSLDVAMGKLTRVEMSVDLGEEEALEPAFAQLVAALARHGKPKVVRRPKSSRFEASWELPRESLSVDTHVGRSRAYDADPYYRVALRLAPRDGVTLADAGDLDWVDVAALAKLCATRAVPEAACAEAFAARFISIGTYAPDVEAAVGRVYAAVVAERADLRATQRGLLAACNWAKLEDTAHDYVRVALWDAMSNPGRLGPVFRIGTHELLALVRLIAKPTDGEAWAWKIVQAIEHRDDAALAEVSAAVSATRRWPGQPRLSFLAPEQRVRLYELATAGLPREERIAWALHAEGDEVYGAAADWLGAPPDDGNNRYARYLDAVRAAAPAQLVACVEQLVERQAYSSPDSVRDACARVADEVRGHAMRIGPLVLTYKDGTNTRRGTFKLARKADAAAATTALAKK